MKRLFIFTIICLAIGCSSSKKSSVVSNPLNGKWTPVRQEFAGNELPAAAFNTQKLIISDSAYTLIAESVDKGTVTYKDGLMDIYGKEGVNSGKHFSAIYKFENKQLTVCYNLAGDSYPTAFETKSKPMLFLSVFEKESTK